MNKLYLKYPLLVEGKYDKIHLSSFIASPIITSDGFSLFNSEQKKKLIKRLTADSPILVLTDSDGAGGFIRGRLKGLFDKDKLINIYSPQIKGKERRKQSVSSQGFLGVEGIDTKSLYELLLPYSENAEAKSFETVSQVDFYNAGLLGGHNSKEKRESLAKCFGLPKDLSSKALFEAVNILGGREAFEKAVETLKTNEAFSGSDFGDSPSIPRIKTVSFYTLGCRVNQYETEALAELALNKGFELRPFGERVDICVVNTCAVTAESERKSAQFIRRASKFADEVRVCGCYSELSPEKVSAIQGVSKAVGCAGKSNIFESSGVDFTEKGYELLKVATTDPKSVPFSSDCRAYVKIQDGCNGNCSYCVIPSLRGPSRSRPPEAIIDEVKRLIASGYKEIILTGIETAAYNCVPLPALIESLARIEGLERIRLGSLDPNCLNDSFLQLARSEPKLMPHFHLSLQSGCERILKLMKRPYTAAQAEARIAKLKAASPKAMLSADIISSFPSESAEEFDETIRYLKRIGFLHIHAFSYSKRPGTPAAEMKGQIDEAEKKRRNALIIAASKEMTGKLLDSKIGTKSKILIESIKNGLYIGHTEDFCEASISSALPLKEGNITEALIIKRDGAVLLGTVV